MSDRLIGSSGTWLNVKRLKPYRKSLTFVAESARVQPSFTKRFVGESPLERQSRACSKGLNTVEIRAEPAAGDFVLRGELLVDADGVLVVVEGPHRGPAEICQVHGARRSKPRHAGERWDAECTVV